VTALPRYIPLGAVTVDLKGENITEMLDMWNAGAVAFTDGFKPIWNADILLKTLMYLKKFNGLLIQKPEDKWLNMLGLMNESTNSAMLGLKRHALNS
jgi:dihydroorotase